MITERKHETVPPEGWTWPTLRYPGEPDVMLMHRYEYTIKCDSENHALALRAAADEWFRLHPEATNAKDPARREPDGAKEGKR